MRLKFFHIRIGILAALVVGLAATRAVALTISPRNPAPEGSVAVPLTTSNTSQTKAGSLEVLGHTTVSPTLTIGQAGGTSQICWNGDCRDSWTEVAEITGFLHLGSSTNPDVGVASIQGTSGVSDPTFGVRAVAGLAEVGKPTFGIKGIAQGNAAQTTAKSYGVYGQAYRDGQSAIYATTKPPGFNFSANAWAGYFYGHVGVAETTGAGVYDLVVGTGSASNNGVAELCLNGVCNSVWPAVSGSGVWSLVTQGAWPNQRNFIQAGDPTASVRVGGSGASAPIAVSVASSGGVPTSASLAVAGPAKYEQYVVGSPDGLGLPVNVTCGDGICNNNECDIGPPASPAGCTMASVGYCPKDCDITPPTDAYYDDIVPIQICRPPQPCPEINPYIYLRWWNGPELDIAGARVIIRTDRFPTGPEDFSYISRGPNFVNSDINGVPNTYYALDPLCMLKTDGGPTYYVALYAYDGVKNFAPGTYFIGQCIDTPPLEPF